MAEMLAARHNLWILHCLLKSPHSTYHAPLVVLQLQQGDWLICASTDASHHRVCRQHGGGTSCTPHTAAAKSWSDIGVSASNQQLSQGAATCLLCRSTFTYFSLHACSGGSQLPCLMPSSAVSAPLWPGAALHSDGSWHDMAQCSFLWARLPC